MFWIAWPFKLLCVGVNVGVVIIVPFISIIGADIDIDECFNLYSFLKTKKMVNGIPAILCYVKGNNGYVPNCSVTGADPAQLHFFFKKCGNILEKINKLNKEPENQIEEH